MATTISAVDTETVISHGTFIDLTLGDITYYISDVYKPVTINSNEYTGLGLLLDVAPITYDYKTTAGSIELTISGVPNSPDFTQILNDTNVKGGDVEIRRAFFYPANATLISGEEYLSFKGVVSNFNIEEETAFISGRATNTIIIECASIYAILEKKISGQRTNGSDRRRYYSGAIDFDRVEYITELPEFDKPG
jgi:hypothetical protein